MGMTKVGIGCITRRCTKLRQLCVNVMPSGRGDDEEIAPCRSLEVVCLQSWSLTDVGLSYLARNNLRELLLPNVLGISVSGISQLAMCKSLVTLELGNEHFHGDGWRDGVSWDDVPDEFDLNGDEVLRAVANIQSLQDLTLMYGDITDVG